MIHIVKEWCQHVHPLLPLTICNFLQLQFHSTVYLQIIFEINSSFCIFTAS